jgi:simple sugar transport system substrate-binding protein
VVALGGFDLLPTTMESIRDGNMQWTIGQDPYTQGLMPVLMAWKQLERGYPGVFYDTGAEVVDASNIAAIIEREQGWIDQTDELGLQP